MVTRHSWGGEARPQPLLFVLLLLVRVWSARVFMIVVTNAALNAVLPALPIAITAILSPHDVVYMYTIFTTFKLSS